MMVQFRETSARVQISLTPFDVGQSTDHVKIRESDRGSAKDQDKRREARRQCCVGGFL